MGESRRMTDSTLTLCDSGADSAQYEGCVYCWNGYGEKENIHSLLRYVEAHGERLRQRYLAWIHDFGEAKIDGKRIVDHLAFEGGLSYWWMTLLAEKSPWKSPEISSVIRLLALEEIVTRERPRKFRLASADIHLHETLSGLCRALNVPYEWEQVRVFRNWHLKLKNIFNMLPQWLQALIYLARYLHTHWPLKKGRKPDWFSGGDALFICTYSDNIDKEAASRGQFSSYYWSGLPELLKRSGKLGNWLQLYIPSVDESGTSAAISRLQRFNQQAHLNGLHAFLETYLSWRVIWQAVKRWFWLSKVSRRLENRVKQAFRPVDSQLLLWPIMRYDWQASMRGLTAIGNLFWFELFDAALAAIPHQSKGLYLCENQAWERALIYAWRKHGHGQLIAVPHSTVRFWDMRYFFDPRVLCSSGDNKMPQPSLIALNGRAVVEAFIGAGYSRGSIAECEALRYGYLSRLQRQNYFKREKVSEIKVLVLGDYMISSTIKMLELLESSVGYMTISASYTVKPHPNCWIDPENYPALHLKVAQGSLEDILLDCDVVYASNMTSAVIDARFTGLPLVVMLDECNLNFSPLRGQRDVCFAGNPEELAHALQAVSHNVTKVQNGEDFFYLDTELHRWSNLLAN